MSFKLCLEFKSTIPIKIVTVNYQYNEPNNDFIYQYLVASDHGLAHHFDEIHESEFG